MWEACWRAVVNVMNHTIITARTRFRATHAFDAAAVCQNIIECHVRTSAQKDVRENV